MAGNHGRTSNNSKRCFVVMGFGTKTDYATGRRLDLDKSYRDLIKPVVKKKGLKCIRADEIPHSQIIDVPMYQELLTADVVIADLSTANPNALYELGIRHALKPWTTIVISENKLPYPFDLNHITISSYTHLGDDIGYEEVFRFRKILREKLNQVLKAPKTDSPVYTFLKDLTPPRLEDHAAQVATQSRQPLKGAGRTNTKARAKILAQGIGHGDKTLAVLIEEGEQAIDEERFTDAKAKFTLALQLCEKTDQHCPFASDPYIVQRLVRATFKAEEPDRFSALNEAIRILESKLNLKDSNDPETVGLASNIEKKLFFISQEPEHLDRAIRYCARGYYLRGNRYNGINLAFLLNVRTDTDKTKELKIADLVWANRIRLEVLELCEQEMNEIRQREKRRPDRTLSKPDKLYVDLRARDKTRKFWCLAAKAEAHFGLGELDDYERARAKAQRVKHGHWRMVAFDDKIKRLRESLESYGHLLNPPWPVRESRAPRYVPDPRA
jgi:hypothetical protein